MLLRNSLEFIYPCAAEPVSFKKLREASSEIFRTHPVFQHIQSERAFVVKQSRESLWIIGDMTEARAQNERSRIRLFFHPFLENICQFFPRFFAMVMAHILPGSKLGKTFRQPLIAIRFPSNGLSPPLMSDFVCEQKLRILRNMKRIFDEFLLEKL